MKIEHLDQPADIYHLLHKAEFWHFGKPLRRILHLLVRKGKARTILIQENVVSQEYREECALLKRSTERGCQRLDFFASEITELDRLADHQEYYSGYCEVRPDGSIVKAMISDDVIIRPDSYSHIVCRLEENCQLAGVDFKVTGFPFIEKDNYTIVCSQTAVSAVLQYWNYLDPTQNRATTVEAFGKALGKSRVDSEVAAAIGLTPQEIQELVESQKLHCHIVPVHSIEKGGKSEHPETTERMDESTQNKDGDRLQVRNPCAAIYSYLEAGFPVIVVVRTAGKEHHALTVIGHTFDKNAWSAYADPMYYNAPLTGGGGSYHSNWTWIKNFIVQDDNLGPYYFVPCEAINQKIVSIIVGMPFPAIALEPEAAERSAFLALRNLYDTVERIDPRISPVNRWWMRVTMDHLAELSTSRWVLRTILQSGQQIVDSYAEHQFSEVIGARLDQMSRTQPFWRTEISWPNLYCYHGMQIGEIILDARPEAQGDRMIMIRLPGIILVEAARPEDQMRIYHTSDEDGPYLNRQPGNRTPTL